MEVALDMPSDEELTRMAEEEAPEEIVVVDEESLALINTVTGEITGYKEIPPEDLEDLELAKWIGERRAYHKGRVEGLKAEKQVWIDTINKRFDTRIRNHEGAIKWFEATYHDLLFALAKKLIGDGKKRSAAIGLLLLKLTKTRAKTEILDNERAVAWLKKANLPEAVKTTETVLTSFIPDEVKFKLVKESNQAKTGIAFRPGGKDELKIE
jgi:hypothetical protein